MNRVTNCEGIKKSTMKKGDIQKNMFKVYHSKNMDPLEFNNEMEIKFKGSISKKRPQLMMFKGYISEEEEDANSNNSSKLSFLEEK